VSVDNGAKRQAGLGCTCVPYFQFNFFIWAKVELFFFEINTKISNNSAMGLRSRDVVGRKRAYESVKILSQCLCISELFPTLVSPTTITLNVGVPCVLENVGRQEYSKTAALEIRNPSSIAKN